MPARTAGAEENQAQPYLLKPRFSGRCSRCFPFPSVPSASRGSHGDEGQTRAAEHLGRSCLLPLSPDLTAKARTAAPRALLRRRSRTSAAPGEIHSAAPARPVPRQPGRRLTSAAGPDMAPPARFLLRRHVRAAAARAAARCSRRCRGAGGPGLGSSAAGAGCVGKEKPRPVVAGIAVPRPVVPVRPAGLGKRFFAVLGTAEAASTTVPTSGRLTPGRALRCWSVSGEGLGAHVRWEAAEGAWIV